MNLLLSEVCLEKKIAELQARPAIFSRGSCGHGRLFCGILDADTICRRLVHGLYRSRLPHPSWGKLCSSEILGIQEFRPSIHHETSLFFSCDAFDVFCPEHSNSLLARRTSRHELHARPGGLLALSLRVEFLFYTDDLRSLDSARSSPGRAVFLYVTYTSLRARTLPSPLLLWC